MDYLYEEKPYSYQTKTKRTNILKKICRKLFRPSFYCLKYFTELKKWYFKAVKLIFLDGHDCWTTSTKFSWKIFVRKYFVSLLFVWNVFPSSKVKFFGDKIYFTGWSRLLKIFFEIATLQCLPQFLSR